MFDDVFLLKLFISFIVSGAYLVLILRIAEKVGTKLGSIILSLPSTTLFSLLFIGWTSGITVATDAALIAQIGFIGIFVFVLTFVLSTSFLSLLLALLLWAISAFFLSTLQLDIFYSFGLAIIALIPCFLILRKVKPEKTTMKSTTRQNIFRFILVGSLISFTIIVSKLGGPVLGGIFSIFPAMYTSTFYLAYKDYGKNFARSIAANTVYGFLGFAIYPFAVYLLYPVYGLIIGTMASYLISLIITYLFNILFK
ncbi:hypothetical protein KKB44_02425 [Candidatus Micrarchaeota archaeon]|nr:hypothetical protein [Candidatus Micrarchaeota archaeon]